MKYIVPSIIYRLCHDCKYFSEYVSVYGWCSYMKKFVRGNHTECPGGFSYRLSSQKNAVQ